MTRPTFTAFKAKALVDPAVKAEYDEVILFYELRKNLIKLRQETGLHKKN